MYLIITRTFPPEVGGMQNLMWGLARSLSKIDMVKVFADYHEDHKIFDDKVSFTIERVSGVKLLRKYRKSLLINEYLNENKNVNCIIADHWKSLELIKSPKKKICLIHSKEINHPKGSRLNKKVLEVLNNVDHVVANSNFTKNLVDTCDELSFQEIKICMCIKLSYSNVQIEKQLNISPSTLSNMRSSIRKKMGLSRSQNLTTTILKI